VVVSGGNTQAAVDVLTAFKTIVPGALVLLTGVVTGLLAAHLQSRQFIREWRRARSDIAAAKAADLIQAIAMDVVKILRASEGLCWRAKYEPDSMNLENYRPLRDWEWEVNSILPGLRGSHVALGAVNGPAAERFDGVFRDIKAHLDEMHADVRACRTGSVEQLAAKLGQVEKRLSELRPLFQRTSEAVLETFELGRAAAPRPIGTSSDD
jgi:hypothetical protein